MEATTQHFADVQSAYDILSDPQERAWYDSHRDAILRDENDVSGEHYNHHVRITTADEILRVFARFRGSIDFSDADVGFFGVLRGLFDTLAREEELACGLEGVEPIQYPSFGHAKDPWEDVVRPFYATWNGFATKKSFSWEDVHRFSEAPDRRVRRMMEKENKRFRQVGVREFNDAVRSLVAFVKKRDPRFKPNKQIEAERQKILRDAVVAQAARSRAANHAKQAQHELTSEWIKSSKDQEAEISDETEDVAKELVECIVCRKSFKSEKQYEAHEKSKKHVKAVQHLRRQMQQEDKRLEVEENNQGDATERLVADNSMASAELHDIADEQILGGHGDSTNYVALSNDQSTQLSQVVQLEFSERGAPEGIHADTKPVPVHYSSDLPSDDDYTSRERIEDRILGKPDEVISTSPELPVATTPPDRMPKGLTSKESSHSNSRPKIGKAKEKRAKRAAQNITANPGLEAEFRCLTCQEGFVSKTRLFNHIKDLNHAKAISKPAKDSRGKKG